MAKVLVIPDTHTRDFWKEAKNIIDDYDKVIFLGDYVDPYKYEFPDLSYEELDKKVIDDFKEIIEFAKQYPEKIVLLDGNHLLHYVDRRYACSRFNRNIAEEIYNIIAKNNELFHPAYLIDDVLFTHAGVTKDWVDFLCKRAGKIYNNNPVEFIESCSFGQLMMCGGYRGGSDYCSGPEWLDVHELETDEILPGFYQIFGHTQVGHIGKPWKGDTYACVDTQTMYSLDTETHELTLLQEIPKYDKDIFF